jgi:beta-glucosidase-like glycosyl hydrolase
VTLQELVEYFFVPFKAAVQEGRAQAIMCSCKSTNCPSLPREQTNPLCLCISLGLLDQRFSWKTFGDTIKLLSCCELDNSVSIDGAEAIPSCAHPVLKNQIVRGEWGFRGSFVSDCGAIADEGPDARHNGGVGVHHWCRGTNESDQYETCVAESLRSGCDVECYDDSFGCIFSEYGPSALSHGKITILDIDLAFGRVVRGMIRLGMLDTADANVYSGLGPSDVDTGDSRALSLDAAYQVGLSFSEWICANAATFTPKDAADAV